jgi:hypothetical protein
MRATLVGQLWVLVVLCVLAALWVAVAGVVQGAVPYDRASSVIYDNDGAIESGFTDMYVQALASAGIIELRGLVTTCSYGEERRQPPYAPLSDADQVRERQELVEKARRSGLRNLPDVSPGPSLSLTRPASGRIEDTVPQATPGSWLIVNEARKATPTRPLVVLMGGQATAVADAYLLDPSIADRVMVAWTAANKRSDGYVDSQEYNASVDPWATFIVFERLRVVIFPFRSDRAENTMCAATPKSRLGKLPDTELRQTMIEARWPRAGGKYSEPGYDCDGMPAFPFTRPDYVTRTRRVSFSHWEPGPLNRAIRVPVFRADQHGRALVVWDAKASVATDEWWRRVKAAAWAPAQEEVPVGGNPRPVPGVIEATDFDHGGTGRAYWAKTNKWTKDSWFNPIRFLEHVGILRSPTASRGYKVGPAVAGEWINYTIDAGTSGTYRIETRVATQGPGGTFRLEFDGLDKTGSMAIPDTGGWDAWHVVSRTVSLRAGVQVMRLVMERNGPTGVVGHFDNFRLTRLSADTRQTMARDTPPGTR